MNHLLNADSDNKTEEKPPLPTREPNPPTTGGERHPLWH